MDQVNRVKDSIVNPLTLRRCPRRPGKNPFLPLALAILIFSAISPAEVSAASEAGLKARPVPATLKIFPDSALPPEATRFFRITAVKNEYAPFQVALRAEKRLKEVTLTVGELKGRTGAIDHPASRTLLVETVPVEKPSIPSQGSGDKSFPALWPDPLPPFKPFHLEAKQTRAVWIDLFIPADTHADLYRGTIEVSAENAAPVKIPIEIEVRNITIPTSPSLRTAFGNSALSACLEKAHGTLKGSHQYRRLMQEYYWFLVEHRLSPYHIPVDVFDDEARRFLDDPRVTSFVVPIQIGESKKGNLWDDSEMKRISDRLEQTGWIEKGIVYLIDEPPPEAVPDVVRVGKRIHAINPRLNYLMTPHSGHLLFDQNVVDEAEIDVWAPLLTVMSSHKERKVLLREQKRGKQLWWYTCVVPKWRGINYFIDEAATAPRIHPWMSCLYGNQGILYWATDNWTRVNCDPWRKTETYPTGNGDGSLLYPGRDGFDHPVASIRLKMLREGLEDYELLELLAHRLKKAASMIGGAALNYHPEKRLFEHALGLVTEEGRSHASGEDVPYLKYVTRDYQDIERQRDMVINEVDQALKPPLLLVETIPSDNDYISSGYATVSGYAEAGSVVQVNGIVGVQLRQNGFHSLVPLVPGTNVVTVTAKDGSGRTKTIMRTLNRKNEK